MPTFGQHIRKHRRKQGLTQAQLAQKLGVAQSYIAYLENNERKAPSEIIQKLAQHLELPADQLYLLANPEVSELFPGKSFEKQATLPPYLRELQRNKSLRKQHSITDKDIEMLAAIQARGEIRSEEDYIFLLNTIRHVFKE